MKASTEPWFVDKIYRKLNDKLMGKSEVYPHDVGNYVEVIFDDYTPFGVQPKTTGLTVAAKVISEQKTFSPCLTPASFTHI